MFSDFPLLAMKWNYNITVCNFLRGAFTTPDINLQCPLGRETSSNISVTINNLDSRRKPISGGLSVFFTGTELSQFKFLASQGVELKLSGVDVKSQVDPDEWETKSCTQ